MPIHWLRRPWELRRGFGTCLQIWGLRSFESFLSLAMSVWQASLQVLIFSLNTNIDELPWKIRELVVLSIKDFPGLIKVGRAEQVPQFFFGMSIQ